MMQFKIITKAHHEDYHTVTGKISFHETKRTLATINFTLKINDDSEIEEITLHSSEKFQPVYQARKDEKIDITAPMEEQTLCFYCYAQIDEILKQVKEKRNIVFDYQDVYFKQFKISHLKKMMQNYTYRLTNHIRLHQSFVEIVDPKKFKA